VTDEVMQEGNPAEFHPEDLDPAAEGETIGSEGPTSEDAGVEAAPDERNEETGGADVRIAELEQALSAKDGEVASLRQYAGELEAMLSATRDSLAEAVASYRGMVVRGNPGVVGELISGDSIESIDESLHRAKELVGRVRQGLEAEVSLARVPAGAPERRALDLSALSPREKIQHGIGGRR